MANSNELFILHVRTRSADKVRDVAQKCGLSCSEVLTRMIDYACEHAELREVPNSKFELCFDDNSMNLEVSMA